VEQIILGGNLYLKQKLSDFLVAKKESTENENQLCFSNI
jgi:hypothetical protein